MQDIGFDSGSIIIDEYTDRTWAIKFTSKSSATSNDGFLDYGRTITDVDVIAITSDGTDVSNYLIYGTPSISNNIVYVRLKYDSSLETGKYRLKFDLTFDNGETDGNTFYNIYII